MTHLVPPDYWCAKHYKPPPGTHVNIVHLAGFTRYYVGLRENYNSYRRMDYTNGKLKDQCIGAVSQIFFLILFAAVSDMFV